MGDTEERRQLSGDATARELKVSVMTQAGSRSMASRVPYDVDANPVRDKRGSYTSNSTQEYQVIPTWKARANSSAPSTSQENPKPGAFRVGGFPETREQPSTDLSAHDIENAPGIQFTDTQPEKSSTEDLPMIEATKVDESTSFQFPEQAAIARKELPLAEARAAWSRCATVAAVCGLVIIVGTVIGVVVATMSGSSSAEPEQPPTSSPTSATSAPSPTPTFQAFTSEVDLARAVGNYAAEKDYALLSVLLSQYGYRIGEWNVSLITDFSEVCSPSYRSESDRPALALFNEDITQWDTSRAISMDSMFEAAAIFNQPIGNWSVSKVQNFQEMFKNALYFNRFIGDWDVSSAKAMQAMFEDALWYNQPLANWDTSSVTDMGSMFKNAAAFNQPIGEWDTGSVTNMRSIFENAVDFNQDISGWVSEMSER